MRNLRRLLSVVLVGGALGAALGGCQAIAGLRSLEYSPDGSLPDGAKPDGALPGVDIGACTPSGWCWVHPRPVGVDLRGPATIAGELWVVGYGTTVLRGDGAGPWTWEPLGYQENYLMSVAGTGAKDVWIAGSYGAYHYDGSWVRADIQNTSQEYNAIAIGAQGRTWLVGNEVYTAVANGAFSEVPANANCPGPSFGVVAGTADDAWIVGGNWLKHATPSGTDCSVQVVDPLYGVYLAPDGTRFVVGGVEPSPPEGRDTGTGRARIEATSSQEVTTSATLYAVHGSSSANVWAVGRAGKVLQFDGTRWIDRSLPLPHANRHLYGVHVVSPQRVIAVGERGLVATWNGSAWTLSPEPAFGDIRGVFSLSALGAPPDLWVLADQNLWHFDGKKLERAMAGLGAGVDGRDISGTATNDVWVGGSDGKLRHYDGKTWSVAMGFTANGIEIVHAPRASEVWVAFGTNVHRWDGKTQTTFSIAAPYDYPIALWASATPTPEVWVVLARGNGSGLFRSVGGEAFAEVQPPALAANDWITSVRGAPGTDEVWIATNANHLFRREGAQWVEFPARGAGVRWLSQTADALWATGDSPQVARYVGQGNWETVTLPSDRSVAGVTGGVGVTWIALERGGLLARAR